MRSAFRSFSLIFDRPTFRRVWLALGGSLLVAAAEVVGLALLYPLMLLLTDTGSQKSGLLGELSAILGSPSRDQLTILLAAIVFIAFLVKATLTISFRWWMIGFIYQREAHTSSELLRRYLVAPYWMHLQRNSAELIRNMNEATSQAYSNLVMGLLSAATEIAVIVGIALILFVYQPIPALAAVVYFGLAGMLYQRAISPRAKNAGVIFNASAFRSYRVAQHSLGGVKELKIRNRAQHFLDEYGEARSDMAGAKRLFSFLNELPKYLLEVIFVLGVAVMAAVVFSGDSSGNGVAVLSLFVAAGFRVLPSLVRLMAAITGVRTGAPGFELVTNDLAAFPAPSNLDEPAHEIESLRLTDRLEVEGLSFTYRGSDIPVLQDVSFSLTAGESVGLVGASGAGKSTLVDLILGLHQPSAGAISVDGTDIRHNLPGWQEQIGLVPQDVFLLDESLQANVAFGLTDEEADPSRVAEAIEFAQLEQFVAALPDGLGTFVGERGVRLSGGQRQRIGIARALYLRPSLLVLDEATSALDNETERKIASTIEELRGRLTMLIVAHRLSTVRNCDRIIFLSDGVVEAVGSFDDLASRSAGFAQLVRLADLSSVARTT